MNDGKKDYNVELDNFQVINKKKEKICTINIYIYIYIYIYR